MQAQIRDVAQHGSALAWGARGRWFESSHPDKKKHLTTKCFLYFKEQFFNQLLFKLYDNVLSFF